MPNDACEQTRVPTASRPRLDGCILRHLGQHLRSVVGVSGTSTTPSELTALLARLEDALARREDRHSAAQDLKDALLAAVPGLRAFAFSLTYSADRSDDLVQDTLVRAWTKADSFTPGTNLTAWLCTILRNLFYSEQRKRKREVEDVDGVRAGRLVTLPDQGLHLDLADFRTALATLSRTQQEALMLVGAQGLSYDEAAVICGVAVGTIKSRVNRARTRLVELLGMDGTGDIGADALTRAVPSGP